MNTVEPTTIARTSPQDREWRRADEILSVELPARLSGAALGTMPPAPACNDGSDVSAPAFNEPHAKGGTRPSSLRNCKPSSSASPGDRYRVPALARAAATLVVSPGSTSSYSVAL